MKQVPFTDVSRQSAPTPILLDIMLDGRFLCQMKYPHRGFPQILDGKTVEAYDYKDFEKFVFEKRPSLRNKQIVILPSKQRV